MGGDSVTALEVFDEKFLVESLIERCPKTMMLRELIANALEAACHAPPSRRVIDIRTVDFDSVPKLSIWNTGPGMDAIQLLQVSNIASSIGKEKSLTGNFGMGAKVASLPSNQLGMRYRSCKNGTVHQVILCKRDHVYGRLRFFHPETNEYLEVIDVTEPAGQEYSLDYDWTEVVLLGNDASQDTAKDPYNGDPEQDAQWLATYLYHRFYRVSSGIKISLFKGTHKLDGTRQFIPISGRLNVFEKSETVSLSSGIKIHYLYDAPYEKAPGHNKSISGAVASAVSTCAVVYRNEMYDVRKGKNWTFDAPIFGIPFGPRHVSVHIELPDEARVVPDSYRQFLRYGDGEQAAVSANDFADIVRENRPQWLIDLIRSWAPDSTSDSEIRDELQDLLNQLRVKRISPRVVPNGSIVLGEGNAAASERTSTESEGGSGGARQKAVDLSVLPSGAKRAEIFKNLERAPEIIPLHEDADIEEKGLKGRAARYYMEAGQLFVNMQYPAIAEMRAMLESEYPDSQDPEFVRLLAKQHSERTFVLRIGRTVVYALAKQLNKEWDQKALEIASSPESLSMAADNFSDSLQNVRRDIGRKLRTSRTSTEPSNETELVQ